VSKERKNMSENIFLAEKLNDSEKIKYRKTFHFKKWILWIIGSFIVMLLVTPLLPPNQDDTNEWSLLLSIAFFGIIISLDRLVMGFQYRNKGVIQ
jgi:hypothetical protein